MLIRGNMCVFAVRIGSWDGYMLHRLVGLVIDSISPGVEVDAG